MKETTTMTTKKVKSKLRKSTNLPRKIDDSLKGVIRDLVDEIALLKEEGCQDSGLKWRRRFYQSHHKYL